ncbi:acetylornithine transaminase [Oceanobacillus manasiensis]|uniref:acetylornithine transaminase n=1 Tax=Oceanobacillus manasiensis TaxID=586413 RepID=UPI0005A8684D|nr:acetylornithine transaminase [Oceanobacillus manasiensis]
MSQSISVNELPAVMNVYNRFPIELVKGKGSYVWDKEGKKYLDFTSGIATCNLGHVPEPVHKKLSEQLASLWHCSNLFAIPAQEELAQKLTYHSCYNQVFFCNSGAEANEAAIKLAKKYAKDQGNPERTEIVTFHHSFHGRTGTTMAATAQEKIHQGFEPIVSGFRYLPLNSKDVLSQIDNGKTTAVLVELVQGEGGVRPVEQEWIIALEDYCRQSDILLMVDEIQTGIGRTGTLFAYEQFGIKPDVMTLAKGLGSGFPVGAMLARQEVAASFQPGTHGSTFGGNPLAMTAGAATLDVMLDKQFFQEVVDKSRWLFEALHELKANFPIIKDVRGYGFLIGVEFSENAADIVAAFRDKGVIVLAAGEHVLRILPPLTATWEEIKVFIHTLTGILVEGENNTK